MNDRMFALCSIIVPEIKRHMEETDNPAVRENLRQALIDIGMAIEIEADARGKEAMSPEALAWANAEVERLLAEDRGE